MSLLAIIAALVALLSFVGLWLLALASQRHVMERFPEYGACVYRTRRTVFQEGPVSTWRLIFMAPPRPADAAVQQMRILALVAWGSTLAALTFWALS